MRPPRTELSPQQRGLRISNGFLDGGGGGSGGEKLFFHDARPALATIYGPSKMRVDSLSQRDENNLMGFWMVPKEVCQPRPPLFTDVMGHLSRISARKIVHRQDVVHHFRDDIGYALRAVDQIGQVVDMVEYAAHQRNIDGVGQLVVVESADYTGNIHSVLKLGTAFRTVVDVRDWDEENRVRAHGELTVVGSANASTVLDLVVQIIPKPPGPYLRNEEILEALVQLAIAQEFERRSEEFPLFEKIGATTLPPQPMTPGETLALGVAFLQRKDPRGNDRVIIKGHAVAGPHRITNSESMQGSFQPWRRAIRMLRPSV